MDSDTYHHPMDIAKVITRNKIPPRRKLTTFIIMLKANDCLRDNSGLFSECMKYASNTTAKISDNTITTNMFSKNGNTNQTTGNEMRFAKKTDCRIFFFEIFFLEQYISATSNSKGTVIASASRNVITLWELNNDVMLVIVAEPSEEISSRYSLT